MNEIKSLEGGVMPFTMSSDFSILEKKLGISFKNKDLLTQAFTHRSYLNENPSFNLQHNERLEFLGDAVIELIVTSHLYLDYPEKAEGELTNWRAALVNAKMMTKVSEELGFNDFLLLSKGEAKEGGKARAYILANTFEALLGALYLDSGYAPCDEFIKKYLLRELPDIIKKGSYRDSKSWFQEEAQERVSVTPTYSVLKESGPDHDKLFVVGVFLDKELVAEGEGSSKQEAEEDAAKVALEIKKWK
ncbi:MAG: ribonuclease III [Candidatus Staskawiczbacteria bacterium]|nr:ribonuclease III [Candidatus Staskawiczbacteria bacterium]